MVAGKCYYGERIKETLDSGDIKKYLKGDVIHAGFKWLT